MKTFHSGIMEMFISHVALSLTQRCVELNNIYGFQGEEKHGFVQATCTIHPTKGFLNES